MEILHATCICLEGQGILLRGPSGSGKSDLALRLIDRGALLIADDLVALAMDADGVQASLPAGRERFAGALEVRGIGILSVPHAAGARVDLVIDLGAAQRLPEPYTVQLDGCAVRTLCLNPFEASTPAKIAAALRYEVAHVAA